MRLRALTTSYGPPLCNSVVSIAATRTITTRGQFNPIHDFSYAMERGVRAKDEKSFERLITNPGPLRVAYTPDYLDWLYRSYKAKATYLDARAAAEAKFNGHLVSSEVHSGDERLPGAPPPGHFLRPPHSFRRTAGELKRRNAQHTLDEVAKAQGMLDLFERQPQFPVIHIDRCTRFHLVELFKEIVLERALDATAVWDKALMYRAILTERKHSYPASFRYIFDAVDETVLAKSVESDTGNGDPDPTAIMCPTIEAYYYFLYLVKKYYVDNAVEAHVVLRCHRESTMADLLFSNPPPKDDAEVRQAIDTLRKATSKESQTNEEPPKKSQEEEGRKNVGAKGPRKLVAPESYPPIEMLWQCEENIPLLRVLLFGELNLIVSENSFVKFPAAHAFLTRPYSAESSSQSVAAEGVSFANVIAERRGHLLAPIPRNLASSIDGRVQEVRRLQQRNHRDDIVGFQKLLRSSIAEDNPSAFSSYSDWSYFNPQAVRAEERDRLSRKGMDALRLYDSAMEDLYRQSLEDVQASNSYRQTEDDDTLPSYAPTLPRFVSIIKRDPHISFLITVGLPDKRSSADAAAKHRELEKRIFFLSRALYQTGIEYHKEELRRVNRQKANVAAALLDDFVEKEWGAILQEDDTTLPGLTLSDGKAAMARRIGRYTPFAKRSLDSTGFTTDARAEDYDRWMAPPVVTPATR